MAARHRHKSTVKPKERISTMEKLNNYFRDELKIDLVLKRKLGKGAFGLVYEGKYKGETVAIKVEIDKRSQTLPQEVDIYNHLRASGQHYAGLPSCLYYSNQRAYRVLVMQMMGKNLEHLKERMTGKVFSVYTTLVIAYQMLTHLKYIHSRGVVHKDIKPENMVLFANEGCGQAMISLLDFGLSKHYLRRDGKHIKEKDSEMIEGTIRFMGKHTHQGKECSRRDDFQSLAYSLIYFLKGKLPWQGLTSKCCKDEKGKCHCSESRSRKENNKRERIFKAKRDIPTTELCKGLPPIFEKFLKYSNCLKFEAEPNYDEWKKLFFDEIKKQKGSLEYQLDWMV